MKTMVETTLTVGQLVFILDNAKQAIYPAQIISENCQTTLHGKNITFEALVDLLDNKDKVKRIIDDSNKMFVFTSAEAIESYLINQATIGIQKIIKAASEKMSLFEHNLQKDQLKVIPEKNEPDVFVTLPDGTKALLR